MYPLRSIAFMAELLYPPRQFSVERLQAVHHQAFADVHSRYANFQVVQGGAQMSNPAGVAGAICSATILPDRVRIHEQLTGIASDDFQVRVESVARLIIHELGVPRFLAEQFVVQSLINPRRPVDSTAFLQENLLRLDSAQMEGFGAPPKLLGLRFSFPGTQEGEALFNVRIESYQRDPRSLFMENVGVFKVGISDHNLETASALFARTYAFLEQNLLGFVAQFDGTGD